MAIAQSPSTRWELGAGRGAFLARHKTFIAVELVLVAATLALVVLVKGYPGPLPGLWAGPLPGLWGGFWLLLGIQVYVWAARRWPRLVPANERQEVATYAT